MCCVFSLDTLTLGTLSTSCCAHIAFVINISLYVYSSKYFTMHTLSTNQILYWLKQAEHPGGQANY